ncbi:MAG TPA: hypothetical protein VG448_01715 [Solirubrobacterales bacterium]|nr:hypothetical protein [Solirubrobacterales bacterium]
MKKWKYWKRGLAVATVGIGLVAVVLGLAQFREANRLQAESNQLHRAELDSHFEEVMMGLDRDFVAHPSLRPFFYSAKAELLPPPGRLRAQALATAELIIDFADDIGAYARMRKMANASQRRWTGIVRSYFAESPAVRFAWKRFHDAYDTSTACILGAPFTAGEFLSWRWKLDAPSASWPEVCD